jgi:hypothetical protein
MAVRSILSGNPRISFAAAAKVTQELTRWGLLTESGIPDVRMIKLIRELIATGTFSGFAGSLDASSPARYFYEEFAHELSDKALRALVLPELGVEVEGPAEDSVEVEGKESGALRNPGGDPSRLANVDSTRAPESAPTALGLMGCVERVVAELRAKRFPSAANELLMQEPLGPYASGAQLRLLYKITPSFLASDPEGTKSSRFFGLYLGKRVIRVSCFVALNARFSANSELKTEMVALTSVFNKSLSDSWRVSGPPAAETLVASRVTPMPLGRDPAIIASFLINAWAEMEPRVKDLLSNPTSGIGAAGRLTR